MSEIRNCFIQKHKYKTLQALLQTHTLPASAHCASPNNCYTAPLIKTTTWMKRLYKKRTERADSGAAQRQKLRSTKLYEGHQAGLASRVRSDSRARWPRLINATLQMKGSALTIIPCHNAITQQSDSKIEGSQPPGMIKVLTDLIEWLK